MLLLLLYLQEDFLPRDSQLVNSDQKRGVLHFFTEDNVAKSVNASVKCERIYCVKM